MQKQIILKSINSQKYEGSHPRLTESKNKRNTYNKINIFSNKYSHISSSSFNDDERSNKSSNVASVQLISSKPQISSAKRDQFIQDTKSQLSFHNNQIPSKPPTIIKIQQKTDRNQQNQQLSRYLTQQMQIMQDKYQQKMFCLLQQNNKNINYLKSMLLNQQKQIQQKEIIISKLMINHTHKPSHPSSPKIKITFGGDNQNRANRKLSPNVQQYYLEKIKDLQATLRVLIQSFIASQEQLNKKIQRIQQTLMKFKSSRINKCWTRVDTFCESAQNNLKQLVQRLNCLQKEASMLKQSKSFNKQRQLIGLKSLINDLIIKTTQLQKQQIKKSRKIVQQYLQDDDQFFYPNTERKIYHTNDQYQHFPSSEDQSSITHHFKQNYLINSNDSMQIYASLQKLKNH